MKQFLKDIKPFFYGKHMTYVDIGSYIGDTYETFRKDQSSIYEAYLIEPNPASFSKLEARVKTLDEVKRLTLHNVAVGATPGTLRMKAAADMTKAVVAPSSVPDINPIEAGTFDVPVVTLDALSDSFGRKHISLLKIDVEGFEAEVLKGAQNLLKAEAIDVIYIEAGLDPDSTQHCHYRTIEDILSGFGYRIFRIYEQQHEWIDDNPLLRRMNMAFMSRRFSLENPYRATKDLYAARKLAEQLEADAEAQTEKLAALEKAHAELASMKDTLDAALAVAERERRELRQKLKKHDAASAARVAALERECAQLKRKRDTLKGQNRDLEKRYKAILASTSWKVTRPFRVVVRGLRRLITNKKSYRPKRVRQLLSMSAAQPKRPAAKAANTPPRTSHSGLRQGKVRSPDKILSGTVAKAIGTGLRRTYDRLPERTKAAIPQGAKDLIKSKGLSKGHTSPLVKKYDDKLWGGFSRSALLDLSAIKANTELPAHDRAEACYSLARWHAVQGDFAAALKEMEDRREINPKVAETKKQFMLEALFLCRLCRADDARKLVERYSAGKSFSVSVQLMLANTWNPAVTGVRTAQAEAKVLEHINAVYRHFGLSEIEKRDPAAPLSIDNLRGRDVIPHDDPDNKVTVIVPAYNAAGTIGTALISLAEQSWRNIEVLVVDDCSTDDTAAVVEAFCKTDDRFRLIRQSVNGGSYACRNRALEEANGKYVTIHDADDWAHPARIHVQVKAAIDGNHPFNTSQWARTSVDLAFWGTWRPTEALISINMGSFLFRRALTTIAGVWDEVRISADHEYIKRCEVVARRKRPTSILSGCPLALGRIDSNSLTQSKPTHISTLHHGLRKEYHDSATHFHKKIREGEGIASTKGRYFASPKSIGRDKGETNQYDLVVVTDWNMTAGGSFHSAMNIVLAARSNDMTVAVLQYPRYEKEQDSAIRDDLRTRFLQNGIAIVAAGELIKAETTVVVYPPILQHFMDRFPNIEATRPVIVVNQMAEREISRTDVAYDLEVVKKNIFEYFGRNADWVPVSGLVRRLMESDPRYPKPHQDTWTPLINVDEWFVHKPRWRGRDRQPPVAGRHGRDHRLKWPGDRETLLAAYCANMPCEVRFLGGARQAEALAGRWPSNWQVDAFGSRDVKAFLADLDFFIHYPHEDYIEEFGRAPMEAMAIGVPVVLPPIFKDTFGEAALYAEPHDVWPTIQELWRNEAEWLSRIEAGRDFVRRNCTYKNFSNRLSHRAKNRFSLNGVVA